MYTPLAEAADYPTDWTLTRELREALEAASRPGASFGFFAPDTAPQTIPRDRLLAEAARLAGHLRRRGLQPGDRVAVVLPESYDFIRTFLACVLGGFVPVPMYPPMGLGGIEDYADNAANIVRASRARLLVTSGRLEHLLWALTSRVESLEAVCSLDKMRGPAEMGLSGPLPSPSEPVFLQFTSGSTARPKGVSVTHRSLGANLQAILRHGLRIDPARDSCVSWLPLYHDMGLIGMFLGPLCWQMRAAFINPLDFVMYPEIWLEVLTEERATGTFAPNFAYALTVKKVPREAVAEHDLSRLRIAGCGAEPIHPDTLRNFVEHMAPAGLRPEAMLPAYGMAEATLAVSFIGLDERVSAEQICPDHYAEEGRATPIQAEAARGEPLTFVSCGRTFPGHRLRVVDEQGRPLADRRVGEIVFEGPSVTGGYFGQPRATDETFRPDGLRTGDLGYMVDGELFVTGRKKDLIIINGRNFDPQTIEWEVGELAGVRTGNVVAFSIPGEESERLVVVAETKGDVDLDALARSIKRAVSRSLMLRVSYVELVPRGTLPKTSSGKLQRARTRQQFIDGALGGNMRAVDRSIDLRGITRQVARSLINRMRHFVSQRVRN